MNREGSVLEMYHIRYFLAVGETLNLTRAAERCHVAQPALTRAIKALETELGGELLRRERALSHLTELGQRMLPMLRQCYDTALAAKMVAASIRKGEAAPLSVAVSHTVALGRFTPTLQELSRALPGLQHSAPDNHHQPILASGTSTGRRDSRALALGARGGLYAKAFEGTTVRRPFPAERISQDT